MHLYLSTGSPWNATYSNEEGQVIYEAEYPPMVFSLKPPVITIKRILSNTDSAAASLGSFSTLAEIDYRTSAFLSPHIRYNGIDIDTSEFFKKTGLLWRNRAFKGPDGKEYEWHLGSMYKLYLKNSSDDATVACYHHRKPGSRGNPHPASLEIFPQGQHMLDLIVVTFIFVERLRTDLARNPDGDIR